MDIKKLVDNQREYFFTGATRSYKFRKESLRILKDGVIDNEDKINEVLKLDLNKHPTESYMTETSFKASSIACCSVRRTLLSVFLLSSANFSLSIESLLEVFVFLVSSF